MWQCGGLRSEVGVGNLVPRALLKPGKGALGKRLGGGVLNKCLYGEAPLALRFNPLSFYVPHLLEKGPSFEYVSLTNGALSHTLFMTSYPFLNALSFK